MSSLFIASQEGHLKVVELLLLNGANIHDKETSQGMSSLFIASQEGHLDVVELLLSNGANIHDKDIFDGSTSIIIASQEGHASIVELLLCEGANAHDETDDGDTCLTLTESEEVRFIIRKWSITMVIFLFQELGLFYLMDFNNYNDLQEYIGE